MIAVVEYQDGNVVVTRRGDDKDDTIIRTTIDKDDEDWSASGRVGTIKKIDEGYEVTIDEGEVSYVYVTCKTYEEAEGYAVHWVGKWPDGWCDAHFQKKVEAQ